MARGCETHGKKKKIYCLTCKQSVCHYCALWESDHKDKNFRPLEDVYIDARARIRLQINNICRFVQQLELLLSQIVVHLNNYSGKLQRASETCERSVCQYCALWASDHKDHDFRPLEDVYIDARARIRLQINNVSQVVQQLELQLSQIVVHSNNHSGKLQRASEGRESTSFEGHAEFDHQHSRETRPSADCQVGRTEWSPFCTALLEMSFGINAKIESLNGFINEAEEQLKSSTHIQLVSDSSGIESFLKSHVKRPPPIQSSEMIMKDFVRFEYKLELLNENGSRNISRVYTSDFEVGECWGYTRFCRLSRLENSGFIQDDALTFLFHVRSPSYYNKCVILEKLMFG
ncbi:E3 ubiquitin-protein ligase TRIM37-like [Octopus sinensis]|uniref:E3 ubiquitin-protein ligase TRIM37-like n=1 Tax=Octopus sinensis TaxID=2607531 RepID=A0A6P7TXC6_9MOLL|nr:E3 ubiquitin-protein ligase TRIM37-like [Octopus sinensis]